MSNKTAEQTDQGLDTQLTGMKGDGPSQIAVEDAADGGAVTQRRAAAKRVEFRTQLESLVRREDVPESLKDGVKTYFEVIHQAANEKQ